MDSAGKRKNTEGTARGKRRLEEQPAGRVSKRRKLKDDLTSQDSQESLKPTQSGPSLPVPSQRTPVPTPVESGPSLPGPSQGQRTPMGPPSQPGPFTQFGPSLGQPTPTGAPSQPGPLPDSPPALDDSDGGSPSEPPVPEGVGLSPGDNHL